MRKLIVLFSLFSCFSSYAGYSCHIDTIRDGKVINLSEITSSEGHIRSGHLAELNKEKYRPTHKISLYLYGTISGWKGEEFLEAVIYRNDFKFSKYNDNTELSEKFILKGSSSKTIEFENYIININCGLI